MGALVGVKGIEPNMRFRDGVTVRCLTLRRHSRVLVVLGRIELPSNDYQSFTLPLSYRTMVNRVGVEPTLTRIKSPSLNHSATGPFLECVTGLEPALYGFAIRCLTIQLHTHIFGGCPRNRTWHAFPRWSYSPLPHLEATHPYFWLLWVGLNYRPKSYQLFALPLSYTALNLVHRTGLEPVFPP